MGIKVLVYDDSEALRQSMELLISADEELDLLALMPNAETVETDIKEMKPDVVLMDIDMPEKSGIEGVAIVKEARPETSVIMYTVFEEEDKLFKCLCAGANGYLLKKTPPAKLFEAIQDVLEGGAPMSPTIAKKVLGTFRTTYDPGKYKLSAREIEVLQWLIKGYSIKQIAAEMQLAFDTVRSHLKNIYQKLHVNCGKEAIAKALNERIV